MDTLIAEELKRIPRGPDGSAQNLLRTCYQMLREHGLSQDAIQSPKEALHQAVEEVRKNDPGFKPTLTDSKYFEWPE
ncbi:MAG: hypothetical protein ACRD22_07940 [Terriglobia bacterium]